MASRKSKGRRARGTGTIFYSERKQQWVGRVVVGRKPTGRPKYVECWGRTQGEVVQRMAAAKPPGPEVTLAGWVAHWWPTVANRPNTRRNYRRHLDAYILPALGHLRLVAVTAVDVEGMARQLGESLASTTVAAVLGVAGVVFAAAVRSRLIAVSPVSAARKPKVTKAKVEPYTPAELRLIIGAAEWYSGGGPMALMAAVGCRVGEAIALEVTDMNPTAGTISITKTRHPGTRAVGPPKSENGPRTIRVPAVALPMLVAAAGDRATGPLFTTGSGREYPQQMVGRALAQTLKRLGLAHRRGHVLRHSVATHLVAAGVPVADVAKYLGDSVVTIVRTYLHATGADPAAALDRLYGGRKVGEAKSRGSGKRREA